MLVFGVAGIAVAAAALMAAVQTNSNAKAAAVASSTVAPTWGETSSPRTDSVETPDPIAKANTNTNTNTSVGTGSSASAGAGTGGGSGTRRKCDKGVKKCATGPNEMMTSHGVLRQDSSYAPSRPMDTAALQRFIGKHQSSVVEEIGKIDRRTPIIRIVKGEPLDNSYISQTHDDIYIMVVSSSNIVLKLARGDPKKLLKSMLA